MALENPPQGPDSLSPPDKPDRHNNTHDAYCGAKSLFCNSRFPRNAQRNLIKNRASIERILALFGLLGRPRRIVSAVGDKLKDLL